MQNSVNKVETLEQMEKKIEEEQEFIRSLEERKKIIMHNDDAGYNEDEEQQDIKIPENKDNSISMKAISPAYQISEVFQLSFFASIFWLFIVIYFIQDLEEFYLY